MPKRLRKRFTVSATRFRKTEDLLIRTYNAADARKYYEGRGWTVHSVIPVNTATVRAQNGGGWRLPRGAFDAARMELGLNLPVFIKQIGRVGGTGGVHRLRSRAEATRGVVLKRHENLYHHITIKSYETAETASFYLWHELTHAKQAERAIAKLGLASADWHSNVNACLAAWAKESERQGAFPYATRPIEREANRVANARYTALPLALANRS